MKTKDRIAWIALAVGLLVAAAARTARRIVDEADETSLGKAPQRTEGIGLDPPEDGEIMTADRWPNACSLVSRQDVEAILPDAEEIEEAPPFLVYTPSIKDFAGDSSWKKSDVADAGRCEYIMKLPGERFVATRVWVRVDAVADPKLIAGYLRRSCSAVVTSATALIRAPTRVDSTGVGRVARAR